MAALFVEERRKQLAQHLAQAGMAHFIYPFEETFPRNTKRSIRRTGYFSTWQASWFIGHMVLLADCSPFLLPPPTLSVHPAQAPGPRSAVHTQLMGLVAWWGGPRSPGEVPPSCQLEPAACSQGPAEFFESKSREAGPTLVEFSRSQWMSEASADMLPATSGE